MNFGSIITVRNGPHLRIEETYRLCNVRVKSLTNGKVYEDLVRVKYIDSHQYIPVPGFSEGDEVVYTVTEVSQSNLGAWFVSDEEVGYREWRQADGVTDSKSCIDDIVDKRLSDHEDDNGSAPDQDQSGSETDRETEVGQIEQASTEDVREVVA